ncbi:hypothetical protein [Oricola sp.]|uniref:hypothetical protein n=1 Tax=Oricola sp. TaxID=1979950 RepID=UPI003BABB175
MPTSTPTRAALVVLATTQTVMLAAMLAKVPPHPPFEIPLFALGPFLGAAIAIALAALVMGDETTRIGRLLALTAAVLAALSFGPQKYLDPAFDRIWPAVLVSQAAIVTIAVRLLPQFARRSADTETKAPKAEA